MFRVIGAYAIAAWVAVEVSATTLPLLGFSEAGARVVLVIALIGFPIVVALAWIFDLTPEGIRRTSAPDPAVAGTVPPLVRALGMFGVGVITALVGFLAWSRFGDAEAAVPIDAAGIRSIAVLPFVDLSIAQDQEYFADGITEELLNLLAQIDGLHVPARTSSFAFKGRNEDISEIGRQLRVEAVLEGSVRREGEKLRVVAQLIDVQSGYHVWSETYDREAGEVFAVQDELAQAIMGALRLRIEPAELIARGTNNAVAHDLYLLGLSELYRRTTESLRAALGHFQRALDEDSVYARAWAGLAQTYALLPSHTNYPFEEALNLGTRAAARAIQLDAQLAEAHGALGQIAQTFEWDLQGAERAYRRAVRFDSAYATGYQWYAETLLMLGRAAEAEEAIGRAIQRDPLAPAAIAVQGYIHLVTGRTDAALTAWADLVRLHPDFGLGRLNLVFGLIAAGRNDEAVVHVDRLGMPTEIAAAARTVVLGGPDVTAALQGIDRAVPGSIAVLWHAVAGDRDGGLAVLEKTFAERRDGNLPFVLLHPLLTGFRSDPRFTTITERLSIVLPD